MDHRTIPAKITRPTPGDSFPRTRLFKQLDRSRRRPVVWLMGPPGAGKTVLASDYLARRRLTTLWYQVDGSDSDIATLFHYLTLAARVAAPRSRRPLPRFTAGRSVDLERYARAFFSELYARLKPPFVVVLDNYQDVPADCALHEVLRLAIDTLPADGQFLVISRNEPPANLARARLHGAVTVLDESDLKLTLTEAHGIARRQLRGRYPRERVTALHDLTHGWTAGLLLMLRQDDPAAVAETAARAGTPGVLFEYFAAEVFEKTDPDTRAILLKSAFLPTMTARTVAALTGERRPADLLAHLSRNNFFTTRYDLPEPAFQYHPLFHSFLRARAERDFPAAELDQLRRQTAAVLIEGKLFEPALPLYAETGDWDAFEQALSRLAPTLLAEGRIAALEQWLLQLPPDRLEASPWLLTWLGTVRVHKTPKEGRELFERAIDAFRERGDARGAQLAWCNVVDSILHESCDFLRLQGWIAAFAGLPALAAPDPELEARVVSSMLNAMVFAYPHHPDIEQWSARALAVLQAEVEPDVRVLAGVQLLILRLSKGEPACAAVVVQHLREALLTQRVTPLREIMAYTVFALYHWMAGESARATETLINALKRSDSLGLPLWDAHLHAHGAAAALTAGDPAAAEEWLERFALLATEARPFDKSLYYHHAAWLALQRGEVALALEHIAACQRMQERLQFWLIDALLVHAQALAQLAAGNPAAAVPLVARLREHAARVGSPLFALKADLLEAQIAFDEERNEEALRYLAAGLALARQQGVMNFHGWLPRAMARLAARALDAGIETDYVRNLIQARALPATEEARDLETWPWPIKIYTFGRLSILRGDEPLTFEGRAQIRPLGLLAALIAQGGRGVAVDALAELLWPEADGDAAQRAFDTTLHRLRKLLGHERAVLLSEGRLSLNPAVCWVDAWSLERLIGRLDGLLRQPGPVSGDQAATTCTATRLLGLYRGPFLGNDQTQSWASTARERLHARLLCALSSLGRYCEQQQDWRRAADTYERAVDVNELAEESYQRLMRAYRELGRDADAEAVYRRCCEMLRATLGRDPSPATDALRPTTRQPQTVS